jgi:catechol-2,3-dioxygenase
MTPIDRLHSPARLAHIALRTNKLDEMIKWYCEVLGAHVAHASDKIAFLTYDKEHHRIALVAIEAYRPKPDYEFAGYFHTAFAYDSLKELLETFVRLRNAGILPVRTINHGPTVSMYYSDPDHNQIELQVDSFPDADSTNAWMKSEAFRRNPIGVDFDPDEMLMRLCAGASETELMRRPDAIH